MKVNTVALLAALQSLGTTSRSRSHPASGVIRLEARRNRLHLYCIAVGESTVYQLEKIECDAEQDAVGVRYDHLVASLSVNAETTTVKFEAKQITVASGGATTRMPVVPDIDTLFTLPEFKDMKAVNVDLESLLEGINAVDGCQSKDTTNPVRQSIHIVGDKDGLFCEATMGIIIGRYDAEIKCPDFETLLPLQATAQIVSAIQRKGAGLKLSASAILVAHDMGWVYAPVYAGQFPNTKPIFEAKYKTLGVIQAKAVSDEIKKLVPYFVSDMAPAMDVKFTKNSIHFHFQTPNAEKKFGYDSATGFKKGSCRVNAETFITCLDQIGDVDCEFMLEEGRAYCLKAGKVRVVSSLMIQPKQDEEVPE